MGQNMLQPIFDLVWDGSSLFFKWLFDGWIKEDKKDLNIFFKSTGLKNKLDQYPKIIKSKNKGYIVTIPTGISEADFKKQKLALENYLNKQIDIKNKNGYINIEYLQELPKIINYKKPTKTGELIVPFAESSKGIEFINFKEEPHILLTGTTGSGKSVTLRNILTSLIYLYPNQIELVLIDFKIVELSIFKRLKQVNSYATELQEAKEIIANELEECKNRYKLFEELGVNNIYDYNKKVSAEKRLKYRFIVIEEFVMLTEDKKKIAMSMLKRLASISRASGQFLIITGQRFDNTVIDLVLRANVGNRLCHKMQDEANSRLILDETGAELLKNKGRLIYKSGAYKIECQSYFINDNEINKILEPFKKPKSENKPKADKSIVEDNKTSKKLNNSLTPIKKDITDLSFIDNL